MRNCLACNTGDVQSVQVPKSSGAPSDNREAFGLFPRQQHVLVFSCAVRRECVTNRAASLMLPTGCAGTETHTHTPSTARSLCRHHNMCDNARDYRTFWTVLPSACICEHAFSAIEFHFDAHNLQLLEVQGIFCTENR